MEVRSYYVKYYLLSDTKTTHYLGITLTLNNIGMLLKGILTYLLVHNFVHAKTSLHAHWVHDHHCACNLSSPECACMRD